MGEIPILPWAFNTRISGRIWVTMIWEETSPYVPQFFVETLRHDAATRSNFYLVGHRGYSSPPKKCEKRLDGCEIHQLIGG